MISNLDTIVIDRLKTTYPMGIVTTLVAFDKNISNDGGILRVSASFGKAIAHEIFKKSERNNFCLMRRMNKIKLCVSDKRTCETNHC